MRKIYLLLIILVTVFACKKEDENALHIYNFDTYSWDGDGLIRDVYTISSMSPVTITSTKTFVKDTLMVAGGNKYVYHIKKADNSPYTLTIKNANGEMITQTR